MGRGENLGSGNWQDIAAAVDHCSFDLKLAKESCYIEQLARKGMDNWFYDIVPGVIKMGVKMVVQLWSRYILP